MDNNPQLVPELEKPQAQSELKMSPLATVSFFYDIIKITIGESSYIAKVFPPAKSSNFQRQKQILQSLNHPNILKPVDFNHSLVNKLSTTLKSQLILFPEASKGSLLDYIRSIGYFSERVAIFYIKQIVSALSYAQQKGVIHPHLLAQNVLIHQSYHSQLAGWSNSNGNNYQKIEDLLFAVGELAISICTSRKPFISKDSKSDPFAKFLSDKHINKLWEQIEKIVKRTDKNFSFSNELKTIISDLLLGKVSNLDTILESEWLKKEIEYEQICKQLTLQQNKANSDKQTKKLKAMGIRNEQKQIRAGQGLNFVRKPSRSHSIFQDQYQNLQSYSGDIEEISKSDNHYYFKIFDKDPKFIASHIKARLKDAQVEEDELVDPLLLLKDFQVHLSGSIMKVNCTFGWNYNFIEDKSPIGGLSQGIDVILRMDNGELVGRLELDQSSDLSFQCQNRIRKWFLEHLQNYA